MAPGFTPFSFQTILKKQRLPQHKLHKLAHSIRKKLLTEFRTHIWSPRCDLYKNWMDLQPTTYKQFCLNKVSPATRIVNTINRKPDYTLDDPDTPVTTIVNKDYKNQTVLNHYDKVAWTINIVNNCV